MASLQQSTIGTLRFGRDGSGNLTSTAFGIDSLANNNVKSVGIGWKTGQLLYGGRQAQYNVLIGSAAGKYTYGQKNVGVGTSAFAGFNDRCRGVAVGLDSFRGSSYGRESVAVGALAGCNAFHNPNFVAVGFGASKGGPNYGGDNVTAIGAYALCNAGPNSYNSNSNTALGCGALRDLNTGTFNIAIGFKAGETNDQCCQIIVGANANTAGNPSPPPPTPPFTSCRHTVWGGANNSVCNCIWVNWQSFSDANDKTDIESLTDNEGIDFITRLRPVSYNLDLREKYVINCGYEYGQKDGSQANEKKSYGLIAQEVREVMDDLDLEFAGVGYNGTKDVYNMTMEEFISPITKAIQNLDERTQKLKSKVETL